MALNLLKDKGVPLARQRFTWKDLVQPPFSKLDDDAFTRVRVILMNGIESEALRFSHACARMNKEFQPALAQVRRIEQHQQTLVNWLNPADQSPLETTIGFEQVAIEVTASVAESEPDPYLAQVYRFGLLEDFDHMYRYAALMDRIEGKDANTLVQSYSDILPGRPTSIEHRHPLDDLRRPYDRTNAAFLTKLHALTIMAGEHQTHDYYMTIGPMFADPLARQLYAEILEQACPAPIRYESHRALVRDTLRREVHLSAVGTEFVDREQESEETRDYRTHMNSEGSPSDTVAAGYIWTPGTELAAPARSKR